MNSGRRMSYQWIGALTAAALGAPVALSAGCRPENNDDELPPRLLGVVPQERVVPVTVGFRLSFSEPLNPATVSADLTSNLLSVVLVPRSRAESPFTPIFNDALLSDLRSPPLSQSRADHAVLLDLALENDDTVVSVMPQRNLDPGRAYVLLVGAVRDTSGNPLVDASGTKAPFVWEFTTDAGPPRVVRADIGSTVVPNRRRIAVTFNQPVTGVDARTLRVLPGDGAAAPAVEAILLDEASVSATIFLEPLGAGCARLTPGGSYTLEASGGIRALTGQALEPFSVAFRTSDACDLLDNIISDVNVAAADVSAFVRFSSTKPSTTEIRFGLLGGSLDCLGAPCPVLGAVTTTVGQPHEVTVVGLTVDTDYAFVVTAEDEVGFVGTASGTFRTSRLPKVAINEVMADPTSTSDAQGEFIELTSWEEAEPHDISGWVLTVTKLPKNPAETPNRAVIPAGVVVAPGTFVVLADTAFLTESYPGLAPDAVVTFADFDGLQNQAILIELLDQAGRVISSVASPSPRPGRSLERTAPDAPDEATSFCFSRQDTGPTPGRDNSVAARGCE